MSHKKGLNSAHLKYIAMVLMLLDHFGSFFRPGIYSWIRSAFGVEWPWDYYIYASVFLLGRIAFPLFAFQLSEGIRYTRSPGIYMGRLLVFGIASEIPFRWMQQVLADERLHVSFAFRNVMFTMLLAVAACYLYRQLSERGIPAGGAMVPAVVLALLAEQLEMDYGAAGVTLVFAFYLAGKASHRAWILIIWAVYTYIAGSWSAGNFYGQYGWYFVSVAVLCTLYALLAIPLITIYNREKGKTPRYLFYLFYPGHLWILSGLYMLYK